jgi:ubiquinone/menaquinone biosynthesis C-methylase UbiE
MNQYKFERRDFEKPSIWFILEDFLKNLVGEYFLYGPYIETFGLNGHEKVLEFGCGGGVGSRCIAKKLLRGGNLTGIDTSLYWTRKARKRLENYKNVQIKTGDIGKLDIPDSVYDVIFTIHVIHDIDPTLREGVINSLARKLNKDGAFYIREPIRESHGMPVSEIQNLMSKAGLEEIEQKVVKSEYKGKFKRRNSR